MLYSADVDGLQYGHNQQDPKGRSEILLKKVDGLQVTQDDQDVVHEHHCVHGKILHLAEYDQSNVAMIDVLNGVVVVPDERVHKVGHLLGIISIFLQPLQ